MSTPPENHVKMTKDGALADVHESEVDLWRGYGWEIEGAVPVDSSPEPTAFGDMKVSELRALAVEAGLTISKSTPRADLVAALEAAQKSKDT